MRPWFLFLHRQFWPLSALLFGPWSGALLVSWAIQLTAGSQAGESIHTHADALRVVLVSLGSLYCVLAFLRWTVGRPAPGPEPPAPRSEVAHGLSTGQIMGWGLLGVLLIPALVLLSTISYQSYFVSAFTQIFHLDSSMNMGLIWLVSIAMLIMTPIMVVWLVWMWRIWATHRTSQEAADTWDHEYE